MSELSFAIGLIIGSAISAFGAFFGYRMARIHYSDDDDA